MGTAAALTLAACALATEAVARQSVAPPPSPPPASAPTTPAPAVPAAAAKAAASKGGPITWEKLQPYIRSTMAISRDDYERYSLRIEMLAEPGADDPALRAAILESMVSAHDDIAWIVGEVLSGRILMGSPIRQGDVVRINPTYLRAVCESPSFADPLRRYVDATLRAKGMTCADCLSGLRPSRDVTWSEVKEYIGDFIHVAEVTEDGQVVLRIATGENHLPDFTRVQQDLAAAVYALLQGVSRTSTPFQSAVREALNASIPEIENDAPVLAAKKLNVILPQRVLADPRTIEAIVPGLAKSLDLHGLRCPSAPRPAPGR
jgi:hypothetical protein